MVLCVQIERLSAALTALPALMDRYQNAEISFADETLKWLDETEKTMSMLRLPEGTEMSALRGRILRAGDTAQTTDGKSLRSVSRRNRNAAASQALERAEEVLRRRLLAAEDRLRAFEDKLCEGVTAFVLQGPLPDRTAPYTAWLNDVWNRFREQPATRPLALYLAASLAAVDRLYILDKVLERLTA